jgi:uncharacterized protein YbjT (DUF2867 family)
MRPVAKESSPVLIIGGTRGTGLLIAHLLVKRGLPVRVLARDPVAAGKRLGPRAEIVRGDLTHPETLPPGIEGARHIIFTAGCRSGHPARESRVRRTEYEGVLSTLDASRRAGFAGRFLYMNAGGAGQRSFWTMALNIYKGNTLEWRARAESAIRASGLDYTIIRAGFLLNHGGGRHGILVTQQPLPLSPRYRIARADVAEVFVTAMGDSRAARTTFDVVWNDRAAEPWPSSLDRLEPDPSSPAPT